MALATGKFKVVTSESDLTTNQTIGEVALYNEDGTPFEGGGGGPVAIGDVSGLQSALDGKADQSALDAAIARIEALESASGGD